MTRLLFYGNCQVDAVEQTLNLDPEVFVTHSVECWTTTIAKEEFTALVAKADILVMQPTADGYRGLDYLSTSYILRHRKKASKVFLFDSCYFRFYYCDMRYREWNGMRLIRPISYHYDTMVECYLGRKTIDEYLEEFVFDPDFKSSTQLDEIAADSLRRLKTKYADNLEKYSGDGVRVLSTHDFTRDNYKQKLLYYSMNHPSKHLVQFVCEELVRFACLPNSIDYSIDVLAMVQCLLYSCVQKNVHFPLANHGPLLQDKVDVRDIVQLYYDAYAKIGLC